MSRALVAASMSRYRDIVEVLLAADAQIVGEEGRECGGAEAEANFHHILSQATPLPAPPSSPSPSPNLIETPSHLLPAHLAPLHVPYPLFPLLVAQAQPFLNTGDARDAGR